MKILVLHNYYQEPGGEDAVVDQEKAVLQGNGHEVSVLSVSNSSLTDMGRKFVAGFGSVYSRSSRQRVADTIATFTPDIVHVHNFFPQLSPSVYYACCAAHVPVVQTLHNFRLICPNALLFREGRPCEACLGKTVAWPGILHACYRRSRVATASVAAMVTTHRIASTWQSAVAAYIALSEFAKRKLIDGGIPANRLFVKPNFLARDPGVRKQQSYGHAFFVGRLSSEKGIKTMLEAWSRVRNRKLVIFGDGPLRGSVEDAARTNPMIEFLGHQRNEVVLERMGSAAFVVFPSECYENFPGVIVEAYAKGVPVLGSNLGSTREVIHDGRTGLLFEAGDSMDLATKTEWLFAHPTELTYMSAAARQEFEQNYTGSRNYDQLMEIYQHAIDISRRN